MTDDGVLTAADARGVWAWVAVRIDAAADLTELREYAELPERERLAKAAADETAWLTGQWDTTAATRVALRYLTEPARDHGGGAGNSRLTCVLLGRVQAGQHDEAVAAALALRRRLAALPRHVQGGEVTDSALIRHWLAPFAAHPAGVAEIRKRIRVGRPNRPDAGVAYYLAVEPFTVAANAWEPVWRWLAAHPEPLLLDLVLEPCAVPPDISGLLHQLATRYRQLATPGSMVTSAQLRQIPLPADAFAVDAERLYADAARRYTGRAFRLRVTLASPAPLPDPLAELIGATISPPQRDLGRHALNATFTGPAHVVVRPEPDELPTAWSNVTTLDRLRWDAQYLGALPTLPPPALRDLAELVDPAEAGAALRLPSAQHGTMPGFPVRRPGITVETDHQAAGARIELGRQIVGDRPAGPLGLGLDELTRHAVAVGTSGSGKTNTALVLCEQLWRDHRVPFLVLEPANTTRDDYRWLATRPGLGELVVLTAGDERVAPLRLNPLEVPDGVRVSTHINGLLSCFDAAFGLRDPLPTIFHRALRAAYARTGIMPDETAGEQHVGRWPLLSDVVGTMTQEGESLDRAGEPRPEALTGSLHRLRSLTEGVCGGTLDCASSYPVADLLSRPVVIELAGLGDDRREQSLVTALLLQTMTEYARVHREDDSLAHVTVIEEAHRLLGHPAPGTSPHEAAAQTAAVRSLAHQLAESRAYGESVVLIEQLPGKLVEDAYKNANLKIMHHLPARDDRALLGDTMRLAPDQERHAATLEPFTAFVHHAGLDRPALVRIPDLRGQAAQAAGLRRALLADNSALRQRYLALAKADPAVDAARSPFAECEGCRHRCAFRSRAMTVTRNEHVAGLRDRIAVYPTASAAQTAWWRETAEWVRTISEDAPLPAAETDSAARLDYEACVFVHISRGAWRRDALRWNRLFRMHAGPESTSSENAGSENTAAPPGSADPEGAATSRGA
jgi:hypothetical protein